MLDTNAGVVAEYDVGSPLTAVCMSPNLQYCAVGARDAVKVLGLGAQGFEEKKTLSYSGAGRRCAA
jgi:hypothetical protein